MNYNYDKYIDRNMEYIKGLAKRPLYDAGYRKPPRKDNRSVYALQNNSPQDYIGDNR